MMRIATMVSIVAMLMWMALPAAAQTRTRVFVETLEYTGPEMVVGGVTYVDAARFATSMGWAAKTSEEGTAIADSASKLDIKPGLTVNGIPFSGATRIENGTLYVSVNDLVDTLHGTVKTVPEFHSLKLAIPGMPTAAALADHPVRKMVEVKNEPVSYRLVEFYASW